MSASLIISKHLYLQHSQPMSESERRQAANAALRQKIDQIQAGNQALKTAIDEMADRLIQRASQALGLCLIPSMR